MTIFPILGQYEVWQFINLTGDTHPMHIHLNPFQVLARHPVTVTVPDGGITDTLTGATVRYGRGTNDPLTHALDDNELGLKDTNAQGPTPYASARATGGPCTRRRARCSARRGERVPNSRAMRAAAIANITTNIVALWPRLNAVIAAGSTGPRVTSIRP